MKIYFRITDMEMHRFTKKCESVLCIDLMKTWISYKRRKVSDKLIGPCQLINHENGTPYIGNGYPASMKIRTLCRINWSNLRKSWFNTNYDFQVIIPEDQYINLKD